MDVGLGLGLGRGWALSSRKGGVGAGKEEVWMHIREACGHFRRPLENEIATQRILQDGKRNARYLLRCQRPPSQIWSEAKRFMRLLELKNTSRPFPNWKL